MCCEGVPVRRSGLLIVMDDQSLARSVRIDYIQYEFIRFGKRYCDFNQGNRRIRERTVAGATESAVTRTPGESGLFTESRVGVTLTVAACPLSTSFHLVSSPVRTRRTRTSTDPNGMLSILFSNDAMVLTNSDCPI